MEWSWGWGWDVVRNGPNIGEGAIVYALGLRSGVAWGLRNQNISKVTYQKKPALDVPHPLVRRRKQAGPSSALAPSLSLAHESKCHMYDCPASLHCQHGPDLVGIALINQPVSHIQEGREREREREGDLSAFVRSFVLEPSFGCVSVFGQWWTRRHCLFGCELASV